MNERIKQITGQVLDELVPETWVALGYDKIKEIQNRTAELIVAECLRQVEEQYKPVLEDKEMMKDTHWDGYVQCGVDSYVAIREHFFGVEE
jgi:hypothetical protein